MSLKQLQQTSTALQDFLKKSQIELKGKFKKTVFQMAHDLGSPLMALSIVAENSKNLTDKERSMLKESAARIKEICKNMVDQFKTEELSSNELFPNVEDGAQSPIVHKITLSATDTILVLDDDTSVHSAWNLRFDSVLKQNPSLQIMHFVQAHDLLDFIKKINQVESDRFLLLSDYELPDQDINGLEVIKLAKIKRSILVTSHYANPDVLREVIRTKTQLLPKKSAFEVNIEIIT